MTHALFAIVMLAPQAVTAGSAGGGSTPAPAPPAGGFMPCSASAGSAAGSSVLLLIGVAVFGLGAGVPLLRWAQSWN